MKRRVFLNGHIDAAWEFTLNYHFGGVVFEIPNVMALIGVIFYMAISISALCGAGSRVQLAARRGIVFLPFFLPIHPVRAFIVLFKKGAVISRQSCFSRMDCRKLCRMNSVIFDPLQVKQNDHCKPSLHYNGILSHYVSKKFPSIK